jgi:hypothetical protein
LSPLSLFYFISAQVTPTLLHNRPYLGGCAADGGMPVQGREAVVAGVGTTAVEGWAGYWCQASPCQTPGHCSDDLILVTTEKEQVLLHSLRPARTEKYRVFIHVGTLDAIQHRQKRLTD